MGKNWKGGRGGGGGGRGGGGSNDTASVRGNAAIIATCDAARERETNKEMLNLLNQTIEEIYPELVEVSGSIESDETVETKTSSDFLSEEIAALRQQTKKSSVMLMSVNTGIKGLCLIKVMNKKICPVRLVAAVFERVLNKKEAVSRHVVRVIPLMKTFYPNEDQLKEYSSVLCKEVFSCYFPVVQNSSTDTEKVSSNEMVIGEVRVRDSEEDVQGDSKRIKLADPETCEPSPQKCPSSSAVLSVSASAPGNAQPTIIYSVLFKKRDHDVLKREPVQEIVRQNMPKNARVDYKVPKVWYDLVCT